MLLLVPFLAAATASAQTPDLTIAKSHTGNLTQGQTGTYTLVASNVGTAPSSGTVILSDAVPAGLRPIAASGTGWACAVGGQSATCSRSDPLAPGASFPFVTLTVVVAGNAPASVTNTALVLGGGEVSTGNNTAADPTTVIAVPDLIIAKSHAVNFLQGQVGAQYQISVSNVGGAPTSGPVTVSDTLPAGLTPTAAAGAGWVCTVAAPNVSCSRSDALNVGASYPTITLTVNVAPAAPPSVTNTASVSGGGEVNTSNDSDSDITTVGPGLDLILSKSHSGNFTQGQVGASFILNVTNIGTSPSSGTVIVLDTVFGDLTPAAASGSGWACNILGQDATCTRSDPLGAQQSYPPITLQVDVSPTAASPLPNLATVAGNGDVNVSNDIATDVAVILTSTADLSIAKSVDTATPAIGTNVHFRLNVTNAGPLPASGVSVTDVLPAGYAFVSTTASQGSVSGTTTVTWSAGSLASGATAALEIVATVLASGPYANTGAVVSLLADPAPGDNVSTLIPTPVAAVNAVNDASVTPFGTPVTTSVLANDTSDRPLDPASVTVTVASPSGTTSVNPATGAITFTPNAGFGGTASYTYRVCDTSSPTPVCDAAVVTVQVASPPLLTSSANPSVFGQPVTFTATVTGNAPTGILVFRDGATTLCSATASTSGNTATATCTTSNLSVGTHPITAAYSGDANNAAAASAVLNQTVNRASTTTTVTPPAAITLGQSATITATVAAVAPGAGTPTGTVTISDGSVSCTAPLSGGNAGCALTPTAAGTRTVTATYSGDTSFATSSGRASLLVNAPPTATPRPTPIPPPTSVPALDRWALLLLAVLTALLAAWRLRRSSR